MKSGDEISEPFWSSAGEKRPSEADFLDAGHDVKRLHTKPPEAWDHDLSTFQNFTTSPFMLQYENPAESNASGLIFPPLVTTNISCLTLSDPNVALEGWVANYRVDIADCWSAESDPDFYPVHNDHCGIQAYSTGSLGNLSTVQQILASEFSSQDMSSGMIEPDLNYSGEHYFQPQPYVKDQTLLNLDSESGSIHYLRGCSEPNFLDSNLVLNEDYTRQSPPLGAAKAEPLREAFSNPSLTTRSQTPVDDGDKSSLGRSPH